MFRASRVFQVLGLVAVVGQIADGGLVINGWNTDSLATPSGVVQIDVDGFAAATKLISNTTSGESVSVTVSANTGSLNDSSGGSQLGINAAESGDSTQMIDAGGGVTEMISFQFDQPIEITGLGFSGINWDPNTGIAEPADYEFVNVLFGGTHNFTLFSDNADTSHPGFTGATNPILSTGSDDFTGLSWSVPAGQMLDLQFGADVASFSSQAGYKLETVSLTVVPEPSSFLLLVAISVVFLGFRLCSRG